MTDITFTRDLQKRGVQPAQSKLPEISNNDMTDTLADIIVEWAINNNTFDKIIGTTN